MTTAAAASIAGTAVLPVFSAPHDADVLVAVHPPPDHAAATPQSDDEIFETYEVGRTAREILAAGWRGPLALQFPDEMLPDAGRVVDLLTKELADASLSPPRPSPRLHVLADTSYSPCCVDEMAAEHVAAEAVVHYGRACLSPTARLPVVYVFTRRPLDGDAVAAAFRAAFPDRAERVIVVADVRYHHHVDSLVDRLRTEDGYAAVLGTEVARDPLARLPNRRVVGGPEAEAADGMNSPSGYALFHVGTPPTALLLVLSSRFRSFHIYDTTAAAGPAAGSAAATAETAAANLRLRFGNVMATATAGVIGILVNTLSVSGYMAGLAALRARIAAAGKKSYTVVVGRPNPAKLMSFPEIEAWVVVGCWEAGGLLDDPRSEYWRPIVTPFELKVALTREERRAWGGEGGEQWWGGIEAVTGAGAAEEDVGEEAEGEEREEWESDPPEFDWATGELVSTSRPLRLAAAQARARARAAEGGGGALIKRAPGEIAVINGVASPGAEYLRSTRTWQGLGSDFTAEDTPSTALEEGQSGIPMTYMGGRRA